MSFYKNNKAVLYCKFYRPNNARSCRNGEACQFIHDDQAAGPRRYLGSCSQEDTNYYAQGTTVHLNHHGYRTVKIDPKYKYIADKAKPAKSQPQDQVATQDKSNSSKKPTKKTDAIQSNKPLEKEIRANDPGYYSIIEELSREDKEQFEAADFTLGSIPMVPPPFSLA